MKLIFRGGIALRSPQKTSHQEQAQAAQADYQGLRYSRYGVRYTQ